MSSSISTGSPHNSPERKNLLKDFSQKLNELPGDAAKVLKSLESILANAELGSQEAPPQEEMSIKASEILQMIHTPPKDPSSRTNTLAIKTLRTEMIECVHKKVFDLKSQIAKEKLCKEILTEIPPHRIPSFIARANLFYGEHLEEGMHLEKALSQALAKALLRSMIDLPTSEEMEDNTDLQKKIGEDTELHDYICPITHTLVGSDAVYLDHNPRLRYHEQAIKNWIALKLKRRETPLAPMDQQAISYASIKPDPKAAEFVENKLLPWIYPELIHELEPKSSRAQEVEVLHNKDFLLALSAAHSIIQKQYKSILNNRSDLQEIENLKTFAEKTIDRFTLLYPKISSPHLSPPLQKRELKRAAEALKEGSSLEDILMTFNKYLSSIREEERIKAAFPKCLIAEPQWSEFLGEVDDIPLPDGIFDILNRPYPLTPEKKIAETHSLVLIPKMVNEKPLTLNSLLALARSKGYFLSNEFSNDEMSPPVITEHGDAEEVSASWILIANDLMPNSNFISYPEKRSLMNDLSQQSGLHYEVPSLLATATWLLLTHLSWKETHFLEDLLAECQEFFEGCPVVIGGFSSRGFVITIDDAYLNNQPYNPQKDSHYVGVLPMVRLRS